MRHILHCSKVNFFFVFNLGKYQLKTVFLYYPKRFFEIQNMKNDFIDVSKLGLEKHPRIHKKIIQYGTAGFRDKSDELDHVTYRMGLLATLRSKAFNGKTVGLMITASHNPEEDNGVKLCDPKGEMLNQEWETMATDLVNANNDNLAEVLNHIIIANKINCNAPASVYLGRDTRSSSLSLMNAALDGINILKGDKVDFGLLSTPQLHFLVCCANNNIYGLPTVESYYKKLSNAFLNLRSLNKIKEKYDSDLFIDGANGVGALKTEELKPFIKPLKIHIFNDGNTGVLNFKCGADFVKVEQKAPIECNIIKGKRYASLDGDADRLVYFYFDENSHFHLLDGDKIASLVAKYLKELVEGIKSDLEIRVIQTAYANGSSTIYIEKVLNIPVICVSTGVKHLHHEALKYDIGIYFEANGHGTVVFSNEAKEKVKKIISDKNASKNQQFCAEKLLNTIDLINETVGDAISDMLLVETILYDWNWSIENWDSIYRDLPFCLMKAQIPDRQAVVAADADRVCLKPEGLQDAINKEVSKYKNSRSFVRPSGTEDVVRIYAEADSKENAVQLSYDVSELVKLFTQKNNA